MLLGSFSSNVISSQTGSQIKYCWRDSPFFNIPNKNSSFPMQLFTSWSSFAEKRQLFFFRNYWILLLSLKLLSDSLQSFFLQMSRIFFFIAFSSIVFSFKARKVFSLLTVQIQSLRHQLSILWSTLIFWLFSFTSLSYFLYSCYFLTDSNIICNLLTVLLILCMISSQVARSFSGMARPDSSRRL